jgi:hypothetical protein
MNQTIPNITISLPRPAVEYILNVLNQRPRAEVDEVFTAIMAQANEQLAATQPEGSGA